MNTAVIITGHMRTFAACLPTLKWHVFRHYPGAAFYVSTIKDEDAPSAELLREHFPDAPVYIDAIGNQPDLPEPPEPVRFEPYTRSVPLQNVLRQLWQLEQGWELMLAKAHVEPDCVIRVRPDLFFHNFEQPFGPAHDSCYSPWWGRFGGINDRFAVMGYKAAQAYFTTYSRIPELQALGCPLHPESLVKASLLARGCESIDRLKTEFTTTRKDGQHRPPEILPWDLAHAALG